MKLLIASAVIVSFSLAWAFLAASSRVEKKRDEDEVDKWIA